MWHSSWLCVYNNAPTIQVILVALTVIGLLVYTLETRKLVRISFLQLQGNVRPIVSVEDLGGRTCVRNLVSGPALNLRYIEYLGQSDERQKIKTVLGVGEILDVGETRHVRDLVQQITRYEVDYESVSGHRYRSVAQWTGFDNPNPPTLQLESLDDQGKPQAKKRRLS